jgi:hypothetical protein
MYIHTLTSLSRSRQAKPNANSMPFIKKEPIDGDLCERYDGEDQSSEATFRVDTEKRLEAVGKDMSEIKNMLRRKTPLSNLNMHLTPKGKTRHHFVKSRLIYPLQRLSHKALNSPINLIR